MFKQIIIALTLIVAILACDSKQPKKMQINDRSSFLQETLELTPEQASKIKVLLKEQRSRIKEWRKTFEGSHEDMREGFRTIREETDEKIIELLSDEQAQKYIKMMEEKRGRRQRLR